MPSPHPSPAETFEVAFKFLVALLVLTLLGLLFSGWRQPLLDLTFFGTGLTVLGSAVWWTVRLAQRPIGNARAPRAASALPAAASGGTAVIPRRSVEPVSRQRLRDADWFQFEQVIAAISAAGGHEVERLGAPQADGGVDLLLERDHETIVVKCKPRRSHTVDDREVSDLLGSMLAIKSRRGVLVTLGGFTHAARELARQHRIKLVGEDDIVARLEQLRGTERWPQIDGCLESAGQRCPRCESPLAEQTADLVGLRFWICSRSPRCDYVANPTEQQLAA